MLLCFKLWLFKKCADPKTKYYLVWHCNRKNIWSTFSNVLYICLRVCRAYSLKAFGSIRVLLPKRSSNGFSINLFIRLVYSDAPLRNKEEPVLGKMHLPRRETAEKIRYSACLSDTSYPSISQYYVKGKRQVINLVNKFALKTIPQNTHIQTREKIA